MEKSFRYYFYVLFIVAGSRTFLFADFKSAESAYNRHEYVTAIREYEDAAHHGDFRALHNLGIMYWQGKATSPDALKALDCFLAAAKHGVIPSQNMLAEMTLPGLQVPEREQAALSRARQMVSDDPDMMFYVGRLYEFGKAGVPADTKTAMMWYKKAADKGQATAAQSLARLQRSAIPSKNLQMIETTPLHVNFMTGLLFALDRLWDSKHPNPVIPMQLAQPKTGLSALGSMQDPREFWLFLFLVFGGAAVVFIGAALLLFIPIRFFINLKTSSQNLSGIPAAPSTTPVLDQSLSENKKEQFKSIARKRLFAFCLLFTLTLVARHPPEDYLGLWSLGIVVAAIIVIVLLLKSFQCPNCGKLLPSMKVTACPNCSEKVLPTPTTSDLPVVSNPRAAWVRILLNTLILCSVPLAFIFRDHLSLRTFVSLFITWGISIWALCRKQGIVCPTCKTEIPVSRWTSQPKQRHCESCGADLYTELRNS